MTKSIVYSLAAACSLVLTGASASAQLIGIDFSGRNNNDVPGDTLLASERTGVFDQIHWNAFISGTNQNNTTISNLVDSNNTPSPITLSITSNDSWNAAYDTGAPLGSMMDGIIKAQSGEGFSGAAMTFNFNNVPAGTYQLVAYTVENGGTASYDTTVAGTGVTYFTQANDGNGVNSFTRAISTDSAARDLGNYVQFNNVTVGGDGILAMTTTHAGGTDGIGIAGVQLQAVPEPTAFLMLASGAGMLGMLRRRRS